MDITEIGKKIGEKKKMKRIILNPNCSELVTHLGMKSRHSIVQALERINDVPGWNLGVKALAIKEGEFSKKGILFPLTDEMISENVLLVEDEEGRSIRINIQAVMADWAEILSGAKEERGTYPSSWSRVSEKTQKKHDRILKRFRSKYRGSAWGDSIELYRDEYDKPYEYEDEWIEGLRIRLRDGYCDTEGLVVALGQHCMSGQFPAIYEVMKMFKTGYHTHDGGSDDDFVEWMEKEHPDEMMPKVYGSGIY